jgi:hypothetical protein
MYRTQFPNFQKEKNQNQISRIFSVFRFLLDCLDNAALADEIGTAKLQNIRLEIIQMPV